MELRNQYSDYIVEDGFSFEKEGGNPARFRQYFKGLPPEILKQLLAHFNNRSEWEACKIIRELIKSPPSLLTG